MFSYWQEDFDPDAKTPLGVLIELGGDDEAVPQNTQALADELSTSAGDTRITIALVDPYVGAGGYGLAVVWDMLGKGADILAWIAAAKIAAPQVRRVAGHVKERLAIVGSPIYFTPSAIEALYIADLLEREPDLEKLIEEVTLARLGPEPPEPREELLHMYAAYVATVTGFKDELFFARVAILNSQAVLMAEASTLVPVPNGSHWGDFPVSGRALYTGPIQTR